MTTPTDRRVEAALDVYEPHWRKYENNGNLCIDDMTRALAAADAAADDGWCRDMAKAPRDMTMILVFRPNAKDNEYIPKVGMDYWKPSRGAWMLSNQTLPPTAWRPLPAPPKDTAP